MVLRGWGGQEGLGGPGWGFRDLGVPEGLGGLREIRGLRGLTVGRPMLAHSRLALPVATGRDRLRDGEQDRGARRPPQRGRQSPHSLVRRCS